MKKVYMLLLASVLFVCKSNAQLVVFGDDYAAGVSFAPFGGSVNTLSVDNTQFHTGTASLKIPVTSGYTGGALVSAAPTNLSAYNAVTFWAKNDQPTYLLDGVGLGNNATTTVFAVERNGLAITGTWTKFYIPIPAPAKLTAETGLFHFAEGSGQGAYNIWLDDIQYENVPGGILGTPTATFATETQTKPVGETFGANGTVSTFPVNGQNIVLNTPKAYFTWTAADPTKASFDAFGVGTALASGSTTITGKLGAVNASGLLTLNVTGAAAAPTEAAPQPPARNPSDVISLFSGAYADLPGTDWNPAWNQSTVVTEENIFGNPTKKYTNFNYQGVQFANPINASGMVKLHIDVWTADVTTFKVIPIVPGQPEAAKNLTPTASQWTSFDIDLATIGTTPLSNIIQFKFESIPFGGTKAYLDNIYFYKGTALPVKFVSFNVTKNNNTAVLHWSTATEQNNKGFSIERSVDASTWNQINFISGAGNSSNARNYTATDLIPVTGINYYRIKQVDLDGNVTFSTTKTLSFDNGGLKLALFPNPAKNRVSISIGAIESSNAIFSILSSDGRVVKTGSFEKSQGNTVQTIDISNLSKGYYILRLVDGNTQQSAKLNIN